MASKKQQLIQTWIDSNIGTTFSTVQIAKDLGITLPTMLAFMKANSDRFVKVKHGWYQVCAAEVTSGDEPAFSVTDVVPSSPHITHMTLISSTASVISDDSDDTDCVNNTVDDADSDTGNNTMVTSSEPEDRPFDW